MSVDLYGKGGANAQVASLRTGEGADGQQSRKRILKDTGFNPALFTNHVVNKYMRMTLSSMGDTENDQ
jgi:hypothetical protein